MDEELLLLQQRFLQAQEAESTVRLSERNVVELVLKLQQLSLLGADILHTINGKEYLTQHHLRKEMEGEIAKHGRVSLVELAVTIGVDLFHCERQAQLIIQDSPDIELVQGEIITTAYWDTVAEEIEETLQQTGQASVSELAKRFNVGSEVLTAVITARLGSLIHGKLEGGNLYTPAYVGRAKAMMRGALRALTIPTPLSGVWPSLEHLQEEMGIEAGGGGGGEIALMHSMLSSLISEGAIHGTLRGGTASWNPAVFLRSQKEAVEAFFSQNGYLLYDSLKKLAVPQPRQLMQARYPDGVALSTAYVHASVVSQLDAATDEAIQGNSWCDAIPLLTPVLSQADVIQLLEMCPSVKKARKEGKASVMAGTCVVTEELVKDLVDRFEKVVRQNALQAQRRTALGPASTNLPAPSDNQQGAAADGNSDEEDGGRAGNKQKTAKKRKPPVKGAADLGPGSNDLLSSGKTGKGGRKKTGKAGKAGGIPPAGPKSGKGGTKAEKDHEAADVVPSEADIASKILEWYPDMELAGVGEGEDESEGALAYELATHIKPSLVSTWGNLKKVAFSMGAEERKRRRDAIQQRMDELYLNLQLYSKALDLFENDITISPVLHRHLLRVFAAEIADVLLHTQAQEHQISEGLISPNTLLDLPPVGQPLLSVQERLSLAHSLPSDIHDKAIVMVETIDGKNVPMFMTSLESLGEDCGIRLRRLDKKLERTLLHMHKRALMSQLEAEEDPVAALPLAVSLLFAQVHGRALQAPGRAIATVIANLKDAISKVSHEMLMEYHSQTVFYLSFKNSQSAVRGSNDAEYWENQTEQKLKYIMDNMADVKALALRASSISQGLQSSSQSPLRGKSTSFMLSPSAAAAADAAAATAAASLRMSQSYTGSNGIAYPPVSMTRPESAAQPTAGCAQTHRPFMPLLPSLLPPESVSPDVGERVERMETQSSREPSNKSIQANGQGGVAQSFSLHLTLTRALSERDSQGTGAKNGPTSPLLVASVSPTLKGATVHVLRAMQLGGSTSSTWSSSSSLEGKPVGHGSSHCAPPRPPPVPGSASFLAKFMDVGGSSSSSNGGTPVPLPSAMTSSLTSGGLPKGLLTGDALAAVDLTDEAMLTAPVKARAAVWDQRSLSWSALSRPSSRATSRSSSRASSRSSSPAPAVSDSQSVVGRASALLERAISAEQARSDEGRLLPGSSSPSSPPGGNGTSEGSEAMAAASTAASVTDSITALPDKVGDGAVTADSGVEIASDEREEAEQQVQAVIGSG